MFHTVVILPITCPLERPLTGIVSEAVFVTVSVDRYSVLIHHLVAISVAHRSGSVSLAAVNLMASDHWHTAPVKAFAIEVGDFLAGLPYF